MPYDPTDIYTAEPKLLSLEGFPTSLFTALHPPNYDLIMASTRYHRVSEESRGRVSLESSVGENTVDSDLLLHDPMRIDHNEKAPAGQHKFSIHPTAIFRFISLCVWIPAFVLLVLSNRARNTSAIIVISFAIARNIVVLLHHLFSRHIRIRIEFRTHRAAARPEHQTPKWMKAGQMFLVIDIALVLALLITGIIATQGVYDWGLAAPGCALLHIGNVFYFLSLCDMGRPSNVTLYGAIGMSFKYGPDKKPEHSRLSPVYRDEEAQSQAAGSSVIASRSGKTDADSQAIL